MWGEFEEYIDYLDMDKAAADRTLYVRRNSLEGFVEWAEAQGITDVSGVGVRTVSNYVEYLVGEGYAYNTIIQERYVSLEAALRYCYREELMEDSVMERVDKHSMRTKARESMSEDEKKYENEPPAHLTKEEVYELAEHVRPPSDRNALLVKLMFWTGVRPSEARLINRDDIEPEVPRITVYSTKTDGSRPVSYPAAEINPLLRDWIHHGRLRYKAADSSDRLFLGAMGPITTTTINRVVKQAADAAGLQAVSRTTQSGESRAESTAHILRHSHAMHYLNVEKKELELISQHLGHSSVSVTQQFYAQSTGDTIVDEFS